MNLVINGSTRVLEASSPLDWSYDSICNLAGVSPDRNPTVTYSTQTRSGRLTRGDHVDLEEGIILNVCVTGSA